MPPRLLMVKHAALHVVERELPALAFSANCASSTEISDDVLLVHVADDRHEQAALGVDGHADVHVFLEDERVLATSIDALNCGNIFERRGNDLERDRRHGQLAAGLLDLLARTSCAAPRGR